MRTRRCEQFASKFRLESFKVGAHVESSCLEVLKLSNRKDLRTFKSHGIACSRLWPEWNLNPFSWCLLAIVRYRYYGKRVCTTVLSWISIPDCYYLHLKPCLLALEIEAGNRGWKLRQAIESSNRGKSLTVSSEIQREQDKFCSEC